MANSVLLIRHSVLQSPPSAMFYSIEPTVRPSSARHQAMAWVICLHPTTNHLPNGGHVSSGSACRFDRKIFGKR
jgi:hypothetical protein